MITSSKLRHSARHRIRDALQRRILSGELAGGHRLTQMELAREFGVAQTAVRESLLELSFCGLVNTVDNVGVFVSELDSTMLLEAYQIREIFEGLAARLCCARASRHDLSELREMARRIHELGQAGQLDEMGLLDREFHLRTIQISCQQLLERLTEGYRHLGMIVRASRDIDTVYKEHQEIIGAIEHGDGDEAERRARQHVALARQAIEQQVREGRFEPHWVVDRESDSSANPGASQSTQA